MSKRDECEKAWEKYMLDWGADPDDMPSYERYYTRREFRAGWRAAVGGILITKDAHHLLNIIIRRETKCDHPVSEPEPICVGCRVIAAIRELDE